MKVANLSARDVHGYLNINVEFFPDLTFLTGLNGSGKTTALRLLMGLLTPDVKELAQVAYSSVTVTITDKGREVSITSRRSSDSLVLTLDGASAAGSTLELPAAELDLLLQSQGKDTQEKSPFEKKIETHDVVRTIADISTPMFLGLDRRFSTGAQGPNALRLRSMWLKAGTHSGTVPASLTDVDQLVAETLVEIRELQENLDEALRNKILLDAFRYEPVRMEEAKLPMWQDIAKYRELQATIEKVASGLHLPAEQLKQSLNNFFDQLNRVVTSMEELRQNNETVDDEVTREISEWLLNRTQAERILNHVKQFEQYLADRTKINERIERFLALANSFLDQSGKRLSIYSHGLRVALKDGQQTFRALTALSSGERQIVVMLAHLSLNSRLAQSGVFIVDEPELSLHISWQERFVEAIREANPDAQLILATHSPAIIMGQTNKARSLAE